MKSLAVVESIGGYQVLARLKSGGMGDVLLARRAGAYGFEKLLALKTILPDLVESETIRQLFLDEARLMARINHPSIAQVFDFGDAAGTLFLAMEYVEGVSFGTLLKGRLASPGVVARLAAGVCRGLHAAHSLAGTDGQPLGVVHRDVSPQNLMLTFDGHVKVLDFGIALARGRGAPMTEAGSIRGKPAYMSPEHLRGGAVDRRSDVYSVGVVVHELLTGQFLFAQKNAWEIAHAVLQRIGVEPPSKWVAGLPFRLDLAVMQAIASDPADRFVDARAMAEAFEEIAEAMGAESLQGFAERALAADRERHRSELAALGASEVSPPDKAPSPRVTEGETALKPPRRLRSGFVAGLGIALVFGWASLHRRQPSALVEPPSVASQTAPVDPEPEPAPALPPESEPVPAFEKPKPVVAAVAKAKRSSAPGVPPPTRVETRPAEVTFGAEPYALVRVDGKSLGVTPILDFQLEAGRHVIELVAPDTGEVRLSQSVDLGAGERRQFKVR